MAPADDAVKGYLGADWPVHNESVNTWRVTDVLHLLERSPQVNVIPFHLLGNQIWDAHLGASMNNTTLLSDPNAFLYVDCTHHCIGPFLYDPIWWAIFTATMRRLNSTSQL